MLFRRIKRNIRNLRISIQKPGVRRKKTWTPRQKKMMLPLIAALIFLLAGTVIIARLRPVMKQMAVYSVADAMTRMMNTAVSEKISDGGLDYENLARLEKDENGNITALITNMARINILKTEITNGIIEKASGNMATVIKIPIGNIIGGTLLSGRGPSIRVRVVSVTNVSAAFSNEFSSAGINQTRHQIMLHITMDVGILVPGDTTSTTVSTEMVIAETVIVGAVPETYADLGGLPIPR